MQRSNPAFIQRRDAVLLAVLLFVVVSMLTIHGAYIRSRVDPAQVLLEAPPVVSLDVDLTVFERLKLMSP